MYFFGDDYEASINKPQHEIFCYGGYLVYKEEIKDLEQFYYKIKSNYHISNYLPLKWNLKDTNLKNFYKDENKDALLYEVIHEKNGDIRKDVLNGLKKFQIKIVFSGFRELRAETKKSDFLKWSFTNILQRISFDKNENHNIDIILDRDKENCDLFCKTYHHPYYFREGINEEEFLCKNICNNLPFISYSVTIYNPFLQIADMIVGACGSFLDYALKNRNRQKAKKYFKPIIPLIRGFDEKDFDKIFERGLIIKSVLDKEPIKSKIIELYYD